MAARLEKALPFRR